MEVFVEENVVTEVLVVLQGSAVIEYRAFTFGVLEEYSREPSRKFVRYSVDGREFP